MSAKVFSQIRSVYRLLQPLHSPFSAIHQTGIRPLSCPSSGLFEIGSLWPFLIQRCSFGTVESDPTSLRNDVNEICRVLSDFRSPQHDIESALDPFSCKVSTSLVEHVLKRCRNLGASAHRFFLWAQRLPGFSHSSVSYHILVEILGSSNQFPLIWDFLLEMRDSGVHEVRPEIFWIIFRAYCRANLPMDAIRAFKRMSDFGLKPQINDLDHLLYVLCKRKLVKHAQEFFERVKYEFPPSPKTYSILMRGWGDVSDSVEAPKLFDEMLKRGCSIDVPAYNSLLESLCQCGKTDEAYKHFRELRIHGLEPDACTYSIFVRASCQANDVHSAFRVLDRMRRYNLVPNLFTYNGVIKLLCKNGRVDDAYLLLDEMIERGASPDIWSYNAIQAFHCDHSEVNKALRLISRMEKDSCMPDRHTYNMVLKMLIRVGRFDRVMEIWDGMADRGFYPSVSTYAVMIHGLCKKKDKIEDASRYFELMIDEGIPPYPCTCELLRDCLLRFGFHELTDILADKMARSTSCSIQKLSDTMRGDNVNVRSKSEEENFNMNSSRSDEKLSNMNS